MKYPIDLHTHTLASGHAYSTLMENARYASDIGMKVLGTTDHGPAMPNAPHIWHFGNQRVLPRKLFGLTMLYGCEANIVDYEGNLDLPLDYQEGLDYIIASLHYPIMEINRSPELNTQAFLKAMDNPNIHILGHLGNPMFPIYEEEIVKKAKKKNILIEINNSSFVSSRPGSKDKCRKIAILCKEYNTNIVLNSDAHFAHSIGNFDEAIKMLNDINMPQEFIINSSEEKLLDFLKSKGKNI
ncbi:MAG: phosphatase [Clostridia bacterium]|jgi:putative hydrolase|nr:phosphatase [Clostridia bacterium]